jgi:cytochrome c oxidase cbb3-type subunit III
MRLRSLAAVAAVLVAGCRPPGRPAAVSVEGIPDQVVDFAALFATNCAGCHGTEGKGGAALALADPVYLAIADDAVLTRAIRDGVPGSLMPAFGRSGGGLLTDDQVTALVHGIRTRWARTAALHGVVPPPYAPTTQGDVARGAQVFEGFCSECHGRGGRGGSKASAITDGPYLSLISDQGLRTTVIVGRPELGAPDWRGNVPGRPMSPAEVSDVVAWLIAQRPSHSLPPQGPR